MASPPPPTPHSGIAAVPMPAGRYATQGMISPTDPAFVDPATGTLAPVSFRFLHGLFQRIGKLEEALANAGIPIPP